MKKGGGSLDLVLAGIIAFGIVPRLSAAADPFLSLDSTIQTNGQLQFNLNGEDSVTYLIEGSSDMLNWTPVLTNSDQPATRTITVDGSQNFGFYRASRGPLPVFAGAITARSNIDFNGNNVTSDSFDSSDTNDFPGGVYNPIFRRDHGDIAMGYSGTNSIAIGNVNIMGRLLITSNETLSLGANGAIGDVPFVTGGGTGIESAAFIVDDFRFCLLDVSVPYTSGALISPPTGGKTNMLSTGIYYYSGNFSIPNTGDLQVGPFQYVVLYVTGNFNMQSTARIDIQPGGTLVIYVGGSSTSLTAINNAGNATNFQYYGLPGNTSITLAGNASYLGTIYAPGAAVVFAGGGNNTTDLSGALVANSVYVDGHMNFHYDENLARIGPQR